jgi:hypothetical protein
MQTRPQDDFPRLNSVPLPRSSRLHRNSSLNRRHRRSRHGDGEVLVEERPDPAGICALVPVTKKPAIGTSAIAVTTPAVPVTPLSSRPVRRISRSADAYLSKPSAP